MPGSLYCSDYTIRGARKSWEKTSVGNEDAEKTIRRRVALNADIHVVDAVAWWRDDGTLAALVADLSSGSRIEMRQDADGGIRWSIGAGAQA